MKNRFELIREALELTQEQAASRVKVHRNTWRTWENENHEPQTAHRKKIRQLEEEAKKVPGYADLK